MLPRGGDRDGKTRRRPYCQCRRAPRARTAHGRRHDGYTIASKAGVAALTVALAEEVAKDGILVNAVAPSIMDTPANRNAMPKADFAALAESRRGRGDDPVPCLARQYGHARRHRPGLWTLVTTMRRSMIRRVFHEPMPRNGRGPK